MRVLFHIGVVSCIHVLEAKTDLELKWGPYWMQKQAICCLFYVLLM